MDLLVTTIQKPSPEVFEQAMELAAKLSAPLIPRERLSLSALKEQYNVSTIIVTTTNGPIVHTPSGEYFFHLSMAELRIKNLINGKHDHMVTAMGLTAGMSVLDCTLGLATDAIVASFVVGEAGSVIGLDNSPVISAIADIGLKTFILDEEPSGEITKALRRIKVEQYDYTDYLTCAPDNSFDIVYFDPMFRNPIQSSSSLKPIRALADTRALTEKATQEACRVAKKRVIIKEAAGSSEFNRLGITTTVGGKYSSIQYGVIEGQQLGRGTAWKN